MINQVTIAYRLPGREEETYACEVSAKSEAVAFDYAVEELKVDLLVQAMKTWSTDPLAFRTMARAIVQLRPWARDYAYGPKGSPGRTRSSV